MTSFSAKAWLAWTLACAVLVLSISDPAVTLTALVALAWVAATFARSGPEGRSYVLLVKIGLGVTALRVVLFGLTGHTGPTTLFSIPVVSLPGWLGGFALGGRVTGEVLAQEIAEGLAIAAFLLCFGAFMSVVETYRIIRLLPRFLFEAGLVVAIALSFIPTLLRTTADVRDAQRLRGHRFRGLRSWRALVGPVLAGTLERSLALAESMETRGYGRAHAGAVARESRARAMVLGGVAMLAVAGGFALGGHSLVATGVAAAAAIALGAGLRDLSRTVVRTRMSPERTTSWDRVLIALSGIVVVASIAARRSTAAHWYPYPKLQAPDVHPALIAIALMLVAPVPLAAARRVMLQRASIETEPQRVPAS